MEKMAVSLAFWVGVCYNEANMAHMCMRDVIRKTIKAEVYI